jgi:hypothetical protein
MYFSREVSMHTASEYRTEAESYIVLAHKLPHGPRRIRLLEMAQSCLRADQGERTPKQVPANDVSTPRYSGL